MLASKLSRIGCQAQVFFCEDEFNFLHKAPVQLTNVYKTRDYLKNLHKNMQ